jgi:hypothetical protein
MHKGLSGAACCLLAVLAFLAAGCPIAAWLSTLTPPEPVPEKFKLPGKKTLLVLVEDPDGLTSETPLKTDLARKLSNEIEDLALVRKVISQERLIHLMAATNFNSLSIGEIGKKLAVDMVLYVRIAEFQVKDDPMMPVWHGKLTVRVKVVDVGEGLLWPKDELEGYEPPKVDTGSLTSDGSHQQEQRLIEDMATEMTDNIAKLFYKHPGQPHGSLPQDESAAPP